MKVFITIFFTIIYLLLAFFGIGPVLFSDGSMDERVYTFIAVILIYMVLLFVHRIMLKKFIK